MKRNLWLLPVFYGARAAYIYVPFLAPLLLAVGLNDFRILVLIAISQVVSGVMEIPTGYWADRISRKASMMSGTMFGASAFVMYANVDGFNALAVTAAVCSGLSTCLIAGADSALLYETYQSLGRESEAKVADGHTRSIGGITEALTTFAGIGLQTFISYRGFMWIQTGLMGLAFCIAMVLHEESVQHAHIPLRAIMRRCFKTPALTSTLCFAACAGGLSGVLVWWTPVYYLAESGLQIGRGPYGWVYNLCWGVFLMSIFVFRLSIRALDRRRERSLGALIALAAVCYAAVVMSPVAIAMVGVWGTYYIRANIIPIGGQMINEKVISDAERATVHSVSRSIMWVLFGAILAVSSFVAHVSDSARIGVATGGVVIVGLATASFMWVRKANNSQ